jgi:Ca2+/Na+ antiporter
MYTLSFAGFSLCAVALAFASFMADGDRSILVLDWLAVVVGFYLLVHPATRAFAQTERRQPVPVTIESGSEAAEPVGVRRNTIIALIFLLAAIALAGTLGVLRMYQMSN